MISPIIPLKTKAAYKKDAKKRIKSRLTILAISFLVFCTILQLIGFINPLLIKVLAILAGLNIIYLFIKEIYNMMEVSPEKLDSTIQKFNFNDTAIQTIQAIQKNRNIYNRDLQLIKLELNKSRNSLSDNGD